MKRRIFVIVAAGVAVAVVAYGIWSRDQANRKLAKTTHQEAIPQVEVVKPTHGPLTRPLDLPGQIDAWYSAPIYAQVSGYVKMWYKDYGAQVKAGDVLAIIETPALNQQYQQAQSAVRVAEANYNLAVVTARRWQALIASHSVSDQSADEKTANAVAEKAKLDEARQNVEQYAALEVFKRIVAPFDGVVTSRKIDVGDYVTANGGVAGAGAQSSALFRVADVHEMRVFVSVPQSMASFLQPGVTAEMTLSQFPGRNFPAHLDTTAQSFDPLSRTVLTELLVGNPGHTLWPGTYANVHFTVPTDKAILVIPETALLFRSEGLQVVLVQNNKVHLQSVKIGRNFSDTVQVTDGLKADDELVANPSDGFLEGQEVHVATAPAKPGTSPAKK